MIYCNFMFLSLNDFKIHSHFFENNFFHQNAKPCFEKLILNRYVRCKKNGLHSFLAFYILLFGRWTPYLAKCGVTRMMAVKVASSSPLHQRFKASKVLKIWKHEKFKSYIRSRRCPYSKNFEKFRSLLKLLFFRNFLNFFFWNF